MMMMMMMIVFIIIIIIIIQRTRRQTASPLPLATYFEGAEVGRVARGPKRIETPIRTKASKPSEYNPPSRAQSRFLPSSARPLVVFGVIVASNPNSAFVLILAALVPR